MWETGEWSGVEGMIGCEKEVEGTAGLLYPL